MSSRWLPMSVPHVRDHRPDVENLDDSEAGIDEEEAAIACLRLVGGGIRVAKRSGRGSSSGLFCGSGSTSFRLCERGASRARHRWDGSSSRTWCVDGRRRRTIVLASVPVTLWALAEYAFQSEPWTSLYGALIVEGRDRAALGMAGGVRVRPTEGQLRLGAGGVVIAAPLSIFGASASLGSCYDLSSSSHLCLDLEGTMFFAGSDLPDERVATQLQLVIGVAFDAL